LNSPAPDEIGLLVGADANRWTRWIELGGPDPFEGEIACGKTKRGRKKWLSFHP